MSLISKTALVTGAGQGIGRATAQRLARAGANLIIQDIDGEALAETMLHLKAFKVDVLSLTGDLTKAGVPEQVVQDCLKAFGGLDIIINNAGYIWNGALHNHSEAIFTQRCLFES